MPVLYGVFLFMGVAALKGMQVFKHVIISFMHLQHTFRQTYLFFNINCRVLILVCRKSDYRKCCFFFPVCGPSRSHLHAQEVPARSHVSTSRANQACPPLHPLPNHLSGYTVGGEDDKVHLHSLPCHGNVFTRYTSI